MKCPICEVDLQMSDRQGVEIDYCPKCRGVWLDRGELDKIIEKSIDGNSTSERKQEMPESDKRGYLNEQEDDHDSNQENGYGKKRKKEGFLGDLFDF